MNVENAAHMETEKVPIQVAGQLEQMGHLKEAQQNSPGGPEVDLLQEVLKIQFRCMVFQRFALDQN